MIGLRRAAVAAGAAAGVAWAAGCAALHHRAMGPVRRDIAAPDDPGIPAERLEVLTSDGLRLLAWLLPGTRPAAVVVSGGNRGWAGDVLGIATALQGGGFQVVVHGWRGTPGCDPAPHTLGVHERRDLEAVLEATRRRLGGIPVGLLGHSMGGAVAISVGASDPGVAAVCTDCAFDDPLRVLGDGVRRVLRVPGPVLTAPVQAALALRTGARMTDLRPLRRVGEIAPRPLLLIHGGEDAAVPAGHGRRLRAAAGAGATLWLLPGVGHCGGYHANREEYVRRVTGFFEDALLPGTCMDRTTDL